MNGRILCVDFEKGDNIVDSENINKGTGFIREELRTWK